MADIRINALATTAASTASDDFIAVDGSANGTRKLNAYSPTFGGNLTASGNLTVSGTGTSTFSGPVTLSNTASTASYQTGLRLSSTVSGAPNTVQSLEFYSSSLGVALAAVDALRESGSYASSLRFWSTTGPGVLTENMRLTSGGNVLIGTTTDSANGKLQLATHTTSAGGIGFGTDTSLFRANNGRLALNGSSAGFLYFYEGGAEKGYIGTVSGTLYISASTAASAIFSTNGTTALTLDSSQNATFAGNINAGGASNDADIRLHLNAAGTTSAKYAALWRNSSSNKIFHLRADGDLYTAAGATITGAIAIGNTVQTAAAVASTHKVTISIGGSTYYLLATNV